jgi:hypothetical protein
MDFKKLVMPAAVLTAVVTALSYLLGKIGYGVQQLYSISPVSAVTPTVGSKTLAFLAGYIPQVKDFVVPAILILFISAYLILLVGSWLRAKIGMSTGGATTSLAAEILLGTAVFYVLIVGLVMQKWEILVGLAIHTLIAAYATNWIVNKIK